MNGTTPRFRTTQLEAVSSLRAPQGLLNPIYRIGLLLMKYISFFDPLDETSVNS